MTEPSKAVLLSYALEDAKTAAARICEALKAAGIKTRGSQIAPNVNCLMTGSGGALH